MDTHLVAAAKELGETEESMGSIAVVIVGVIIVVIVPPLASLLFYKSVADELSNNLVIV